MNFFLKWCVVVINIENLDKIFISKLYEFRYEFAIFKSLKNSNILHKMFSLEGSVAYPRINPAGDFTSTSIELHKVKSMHLGTVWCCMMS